jgi:hypothetical protein
MPELSGQAQADRGEATPGTATETIEREDSRFVSDSGCELYGVLDRAPRPRGILCALLGAARNLTEAIRRARTKRCAINGHRTA